MRRAAVLTMVAVCSSLMGLTPGPAGAGPPVGVPDLFVGSVSVVEGDTRGAWRPAVVNVTLSEPAASAASVDYATAGGTATAGDDYEAVSGTLAIAAGSGSGQIVVQVKGDQIPEATETVFVELSNPVGVELARTRATVSILDLSAAPGGLSVADVSVVEPDDRQAVKVVTTVALPATPTGPVSVGWATAAGTATAPGDFLARTGSVTIVPPARSARIQLWVRGDTDVEGDETFNLTIDSTDAPVSDPTGTITIADTVTTERVSVSTAGVQANNVSYNAAIADDGQSVAFFSYASNLVAGDTNNTADIFVRDRTAGTTARVSVNSDGQQGDREPSSPPDMSGDGRYVVWASAATNLKAGVVSTKAQIWLHDRATAETSRVSEQPDGTRGYGDSFSPTISADGRYVVYATNAANLANDDTNTARDCVIHDRATATTRVVSRDPAGNQFAAPCRVPAVSANGRYVAFTVQLTPAGRDHRVFLRDLAAGATTMVSVDSNGQPVDVSPNNTPPVLDDNGRYISFYCNGDECGGPEGHYLRDHTAGTLTRPPVGADDITPDGRWLAGSSMHELATGRRVRVGVTRPGTGAGAQLSSVSADGSWVAYQATASDIVEDDTNGFEDIFVARLG